MKKNDKETERPLAYPRPTETDQQLKNQNEYTERQSNRTSEDLPAHGGTGQDAVRDNPQTGSDNTQSTEGLS